MNRLQTVTIVGLGLIGGSIALALRSNSAAERIVGVDVNTDSLRKALHAGVIDAGTDNLAEVVTDADLIVLATPVQQTIRQMERLRSLPVKPGCIITDVASTKREISEYAKGVLPDSIVFIGGHPMAGSEKSGIDAASPRLFENAVYILTPDSDTDPKAVDLLRSVIEQIRAHVLILSPERHDKVVAAISHIPHLVAALLVDQVAELGQSDPLYSRLAAGGFRDVTRIASGSPVMWRDIVLSNRESILDLLKDWNTRTDELIKLIEQGVGEQVESFFTRTRNWRDALPAKAKGAAAHYYELTIDVEDKPGIIGHVASILGQHGINLRNIGILENREEVNGQLLLSFASRRDLESSAYLLKGHGYKVYIRE
jgi:prephenate dehydrogenase